MNISFMGRRIFHIYDHDIMKLDICDYKSVNRCGYKCRRITLNDIDILKKGDFSLANMLPYLKKEKNYSTGLLFIEENSNLPVGYIWLIRRGGNDMTYRVRKTDGLISCVCVFEKYRGHGIAGVMIDGIVKLLKTENCKEVKLGVRSDNYSAIKAYKKAGFYKVDSKHFVRILRKNIPYYKI